MGGNEDMREQRIWHEFDALPPEKQQQVVDFITFLQTRYALPHSTRTGKRTPLTSEPFIGMWRKRKDMQDSTAWVRHIRSREWMSRHA